MANPTPVGNQYFDFIACEENTCAVIDTTICADKLDINEAHSRNVAYYDDNNNKKKKKKNIYKEP